MRRGMLVLVCLTGLVGLPGWSVAQTCPLSTPPYAAYDPYDYEPVTVSSTAIGLTAAKILPTATPPSMALVTVEANTISFTMTATTPTAAVGHQAIAGQTITLCGRPAMAAFRAIRVTADATLKVTYFKAR
jgi:hypothetical protein